MTGVHHKKTWMVVCLILAGAFAVYASVTGPDAGHTGAPGDIGSCVNCHDKPFEQPNLGPGSVRIQGNPAVYEPGQQYTLSVTVQQTARQRYGFQLTAIDADGNRAGTLSPLSTDTRLNPVEGFGNRQYIQHTESGTLPLGAGIRIWQIRWTAPSTDGGTVRFFVAGNAANGDAQNEGDYIYTNTALSESPSSVVTLSLESQLDGLSLEAGSKFLISWSVSNTSNVDSHELRYSTDDGATFPITNLIFSTTNPSATSFEWTVPATPTNQARLRLQTATKSGAAVEVISGRFAITGAGGGGSEPRINSAVVQGKHLFVSGENFLMGAKVEMNSERIKTANLEDFSHELKCKKAGKRIASGDVVTLVVVNPDGGRSNSFSYMRP
jgi:hypothetical protein